MKKMVCTFLGHRADLPEGLGEVIKTTVVELIQRHGVRKFYVGNEGKFDWLTAQVLQNLQKKYPQIEVEVVLAYLPLNQDTMSQKKLPTLYPQEVAEAPKRFAICRRNDWMLQRADYAVCYVKFVGGAKQFMEKAVRQKKYVINLAEKY